MGCIIKGFIFGVSLAAMLVGFGAALAILAGLVHVLFGPL